MNEPVSPQWPEAKAALSQSFPQFYELEPGGPLVLDLNDDGWLLEVKPDGTVLCQYGVAMDDVMSLMSDGTPEDLGTDEVAKQAKYFIQPAVSKFRPLLLQSGFTEQTEMNESFVAATFSRPADFGQVSKLLDLIRWCRRHIGGGGAG
ncbi:hypothetical protein [Nitrospira moscoviensis]|jgi:hypothetical protein|uniref:Uncharacterized protein n=1 Tax=Nitrospira moscoviensis TaxID=42253 RepID=A0A0K2GA47_NITMO|nr:hypothetical protein [Nitrospira moscoviensis]ALA57749.1 hypothetical protein NITMOv2_1321 [Nitrospira moscoviensis]